jgi:hypothetical protein
MDLIESLEFRVGSRPSPRIRTDITIDDFSANFLDLASGSPAESKTFTFDDPLTVYLTGGDIAFQLGHAKATYVLARDTEGNLVGYQTFAFIFRGGAWKTGRPWDPSHPYFMHLYTQNTGGGLLDDWNVTEIVTRYFCGNVTPLTFSKRFEPNIYSLVEQVDINLPASHYRHC